MKLHSVYFGILLLVAGIYYTLSAQNTLPRDNEGWTVFTPHTDTRILYVSSSTGNDSTGIAYTSVSPEIGSNPFLPSGTIKPFKTISAAYSSSRNNAPDWILLKKDDIWYESLQDRSGLSENAPFLVSSYSPGTNRPLLKTGRNAGIDYCCKNFNYVAFADLDFYAHTRNPDSGEYDGPDGACGFNFYVGETHSGTGLLIEGCRFRFYKNNVIQGPGSLSDIVVRRCVILDNYCTTAHSQGLYTNNVSLLLEENIFDHNGWYKQQVDAGNEQAEGQATMFNHNTYFSLAHDVIFRGNMFLRASSIGNKWTANSGEGSVRNITIENNLYVDGEIGISMGGNETEPPYRFKNVKIRENVMLDMGKSQPTNRTLGWYVEVNDWDTGALSGNYFLHKTNPAVNNVYGINIIGQSRHLSVDSNTLFGLNTSGPLLSIDSGTTKSDITVSNNSFHNEHTNGRLVKVTGSLQNYSFHNNNYFSVRNVNEWFEINRTMSGFDEWKSLSGETNSTITEKKYADPNRDIESYMNYLGKSATVSAFIEQVRQQCKSSWKTPFTADSINNWIKEGFVVSTTAINFINSISPFRNFSGKQTSYKMYNLSGRCVGNSAHNAINGKTSQGMAIYSAKHTKPVRKINLNDKK